MPVPFTLRTAIAADGGFLADMVVEAANWGPGNPRPKHEVLIDPGYSRYVAGWQRSSDAGDIALSPEGQPIGAAWYRMLPRTEPGFGYVGTGVPELVIGVKPLWRAHGVGRALLQAVCERAALAGHARISLSVERGNFAQTLYRSERFAITESGNARITMVRRLR